MARISTYKFDNNVTIDDFVIGSDAENNKATRNYKISEIIQSIQVGVLDTIPKIVTVVLEQGETIEQAMTEINLNVTPSDSPTFINFLKPTTVSENNTQLEYRKISYFFPLGNGDYEPITDHISFNDLILNNVSKPNQGDLSFIENTQIIDAGDITGQDISQWLNARVPSIDLSNENLLYIFEYEDDGVSYFAVFDGAAGSYGSNDLSSTLNDFIEFTNSETLSFQEDRNIKAKVINISPTNAFYPVLADEINEVVARVNALASFEISQDEYGVVVANFTSPQGNSYNNLYVITRGKGSYGTGGFTLTNANNHILKIEDGLNAKKVSELENDSSFLTADDLPSITVPSDVSEFNNDANYVNQTELNNALHFRGIYSSFSQINGIASPKNGNYALIVSGNVQQNWIRNASSWELQSAKSYFKDVNSNYEVSDLDANVTIIAQNGFNTLTLNSLNATIGFIIDNKSGSNIQISKTTNATIVFDGDDFIYDNQSAYITYDKVKNTFYIKRSSNEKGTRVGSYLYGNQSTTFTESIAGNFFKPDVDGLSNTYKKEITEQPDVYDTTTNDFSFDKLKVGDTVEIQATGRIETFSTGTSIEINTTTGVSGGNEIVYRLSDLYFNAAKVHNFSSSVRFVLTNSADLFFPTLMEFKSDKRVEYLFDTVFIKVTSLD